MLSLSFLPTLLAILFNLVVGFYIWYIKKKQPTHYFFFIFTIELSLWTLCNYLATTTVDAEASLFFVRLVMAVTAPVPVTVLFFTLTFPNHKFPLSWGWRMVLNIWTLLLAIFSLFTPWVFAQAQISPTGQLQLTSDWGILIVACNIAVTGFLSVYFFFKNAWAAVGIAKARAHLLLTAFVLGIASAIICNFVLVNVWHTSAYVGVGTWLMSLFMVGGIGYALLKIRFTDVAVRMAQATYWLSLGLWVILPFYAFVLLFRSLGDFAFIPGFPLFALWLLFFMQLHRRLPRLLLQLIVTHGIDWEKQHTLLLERLSRELDFQKITHEISDFLGTLIPNRGNLMIGDFSGENDSHMKVLTGTLPLKESPATLFSQCCKYWLTHGYKPIIFEELNLARGWQHKMLLLLMQQNYIAVIAPIMVYDDCRGALLLGTKRNLDLYYVNELTFITQVLADAAPILNRSMIYENSRNFNEYLKRRIARATEKLRKKNEELVEADKLKDEFVSVASHELRTPMTAIKDYMWLIDKNNQAGKTKENAKYIQIVINSNERLISLVNDMLTVSRIEGERYQLSLAKHDLRDLTQSVIDDLTPMAKNKGVALIFKPPVRAQTAQIDRDKILEVLHNIIGNALKFTHKGEVRLTFKRTTGFIHLQVIDTGVGVAKEDFSKLFNKFSRLEKSYVKLKETGTGLGLYISKQIMRLHGGDITFTSELGQGSVFTLTFTSPLTNKTPALQKPTSKP